MEAVVWPAFATVALAAAALVVIDLATHRLPDIITLPAIALTTALLALAAWWVGSAVLFTRAVAGSLSLGGVYLALHWLSRRSLGFGDVKLAILLGLPAGWIGWELVFWAGVLPFVLGGIAALVLLAMRRVTARTHIAFGPFMVLGFILAACLVTT